MYKAVIIDDETLVRVGLKSLINWEEAGFEIVGEASDGQAGLELVLHEKPDVAFTDIKMPVMNGLEMIRQARENNILTKFIILSGYDDFQLVKQALKLGVEDYIIKLEFEAKGIKSILNNINEKIQKEREAAERKNKDEMHLRSNRHTLVEEFFRKLISKVITKREEIIDNLSYLRINLNENSLICALIKFMNTDIHGKYGKEDILLLDFSVTNVIEEIINETYAGYSFKWDTGEYLVVLSGEGGSGISGEFDSSADRIIRMLKKYFNIEVSVGTSNVFGDFSELGKAFKECYMALTDSIYAGSGRIVHYDSHHDNMTSDKNFRKFDRKDEFVKALELNDADLVCSIFEDLGNRLKDDSISPSSVYDLCFQLVYLISDKIVPGDDQNKPVLKNATYENIIRLKSLPEIREWVHSLGGELAEYIRRAGAQQTKRLITKAKKYISEHCREEINMAELAAMLNISPNYFSSMFRKETGLCFTDYVNETKISLAKKLMKETESKIYEISDMLGFENANYFSRVFKKITGVSPSEYKNNI